MRQRIDRTSSNNTRAPSGGAARRHDVSAWVEEIERREKEQKMHSDSARATIEVHVRARSSSMPANESS